MSSRRDEATVVDELRPDRPFLRRRNHSQCCLLLNRCLVIVDDLEHTFLFINDGNPGETRDDLLGAPLSIPSTGL